MSRTLPNPVLEPEPTPLRVGDLERALRAADPSVFLVSPRILRRVIKQDTDTPGFGLRVPHRKTYAISRERLLDIVDRADLDLMSDVELPDLVILIARPAAEALAELRAEEALHKFWRQLFHIRIHVAYDQLADDGRMPAEEVRKRIATLGQTSFDEIRSVLRQDDYLLQPCSDLSVYVEFAAVYWELRFFVPSFLRTYFPGLDDLAQVEELLRRDVDAEAILSATRPLGAPEPELVAEVPSGERAPLAGRVDMPTAAGLRKLPPPKRSNRIAARLEAKADRASEVGNQVRAAIWRSRAARYADPEQATAARDRARTELARLVRRLQAALGFTDPEAAEWVRSLAALLDQSARGIWTPEARLLYDLQKVCVDHERGIYTLDVIAWLTSLGRKPIKRFLPGQRDILISKHLRSAAHRLPAARLSHRARARLAALLQSSVHRAEGHLRARFKPAVDRALDDVKLLPQNPPERVARKKLVDEILDRVVERGFLSMGDLRDALSRNNLKLPDLASASQFVMGDQLLLADRELAESLDGVYRGGEVYRRWPQRLSSLAFGTPLGRFITRYAAVPFGGAFVVLKGLEEVLLITAHSTDAAGLEHLARLLVSTPIILGCGLLVLGLLYQRRFRMLCWQVGAAAARLVRLIVVEAPAWLLRMTWVQEIVRSRPFRLFLRYFLKPLAISILATPVIAVGTGLEATLGSWLVIFLIVNLALNSRIGRNVDEMVTDWTVNTWHRIRIHVVAALFRMIMDLFNQIVETIERLLYTVDEWLRFRAGERRSATVAKACLGTVWFFVNYVIRFCVNLMIEPQVNPIKHFPVVTVSHKLMLPLIVVLQKTLEGPLGAAWAWTIAIFFQFLIPGIFGFMAWEFKENWQLYAANRARNLRPIPIGHHGETVIQFLRPGFRSGTIPKLYARLRKAARKAYWTRNWKSYSKHREALHHVSESLRRFVDRELLELLHESRTWADPSISSGEIHLATNRISIELYCPDLAEDSLWLSFEEQAGWLVADVARRGWIDSLSTARRHALASAMAGFYKMAGVDLVREQVEALLAPSAPGYEVTESALVVWPGRDAPPQSYPLRDWLLSSADSAGPAPPDRGRWVFAAEPISWRRWVVTWELDQVGGFVSHSVISNLHLLPA
jgi:hypothetical protein